MENDIDIKGNPPFVLIGDPPSPAQAFIINEWHKERLKLLASLLEALEEIEDLKGQLKEIRGLNELD